MNREIFIKQERMLENIFATFMQEKGYSVTLHKAESVKDIGRGGFAIKEDKFAVIFNFHGYIYPREFFISVEDRNGNSIIHGETVALYSLTANDEISNKELHDKFNILLNDVYNKYKDYSKENRLDFSFNELELERKEYSDLKENDLEEDLEK